jgi:hypothetical protein
MNKFLAFALSGLLRPTYHDFINCDYSQLASLLAIFNILEMKAPTYKNISCL